jgi:iron(III) transport system ATP-binding protein
LSVTSISLCNLAKSYGGNTVVDGINLEIPSGQFVTLLGPSGCGKSTTLRMMSGFVQPDSGEIRLGNQVVNAVPPERRPTAMVFQSYALWPHKTVAENVAFGLRVRRMSRGEIETRVKRCLAMVGLEGFGDRYPRQLSGGQRQRVALARGLAIEPRIFLLDEPLSNLDAKLRVRMRAELIEMQKRIGVTMVYVTHDQEEALSLSDLIAVMNKGRIEQVGSPYEIYKQPATHFVASFMGHTNFIPAEVSAVDDGWVVAMVEGRPVRAQKRETLQKGQKVLLAVRSEDVRLAATETENLVNGRFHLPEFLGSSTRWHMEVNGRSIAMEQSGYRMPEQPSSEFVLYLPPEEVIAFPDKPAT